MEKFLVHDIETVPESDIAALWVPREQDPKQDDGKPFPPIWVHKVVTIGMLTLDEDLVVVKGGCAMGGAAGVGVNGKVSERDMVVRWSDVASGVFATKTAATAVPLQLVDYNGRGFDVPVLQTRAFHYGIPMAWFFGLMPDNRGQISSYSKEYRDRFHGHHLDVSELWTGSGAFPKPSLKHLAQLIGLPGKLGIDGTKVHEAWKQGRLLEIDTYCMQDVVSTAFVFMRYQFLTGKLTLEKYRTAVGALLAWLDGKPEHAEFLMHVDVKTLKLEL